MAVCTSLHLEPAMQVLPSLDTVKNLPTKSAKMAALSQMATVSLDHQPSACTDDTIL